MRRSSILFAAVMLLLASPAFALFQNGGFETGDLSGWTLEHGLYYGGGPSAITWSAGGVNSGIWTASSTFLGEKAGFDVDPYYGTYSARINIMDDPGYYHASRISQTSSIAQADKDAGGHLYIRWGAFLSDPGHPISDQPFFGIDVLAGGSTVATFYADATQKQGGGWVVAGTNGNGVGDSTVWYKTDTWNVDLNPYANGTPVTITMYVSDCGQGGHGAFALLDGIGSTPLPPPTVPAPGAIVLVSLGMGFVDWLRRRRTLA